MTPSPTLPCCGVASAYPGHAPQCRVLVATFAVIPIWMPGERLRFVLDAEEG